MYVREDVDEACGESAEPVEDHEAHGSHPVFDVVAEDPEGPHVAEDVSQPPCRNMLVKKGQ